MSDAKKEITFNIPDPKLATFNICGGPDKELLVKISLWDGHITFGPNYTPEAASRVFWEYLSEDYRKMLRWKAEHPEAL